MLREVCAIRRCCSALVRRSSSQVVVCVCVCACARVCVTRCQNFKPLGKGWQVWQTAMCSGRFAWLRSTCICMEPTVLSHSLRVWRYLVRPLLVLRFWVSDRPLHWSGLHNWVRAPQQPPRTTRGHETRPLCCWPWFTWTDRLAQPAQALCHADKSDPPSRPDARRLRPFRHRVVSDRRGLRQKTKMLGRGFSRPGCLDHPLSPVEGSHRMAGT